MKFDEMIKESLKNNRLHGKSALEQLHSVLNKLSRLGYPQLHFIS